MFKEYPRRKRNKFGYPLLEPVSPKKQAGFFISSRVGVGIPLIKGINPRIFFPVVFLFILFFCIFFSSCNLQPARAEEIHFKTKEFACKCCGQVKVDKELLLKLETLRFYLGNEPIIVTSGYRCPKHNKTVGGARYSQHMTGKAADIKIKGCNSYAVGKMAKNLGFGFIKVYPGWVHVDTRKIKTNQYAKSRTQ